MKPMLHVPCSGKVVDQNDLDTLIESCKDMCFTAGRFAKKFETDFALFMQHKYCSLVNSGSSANLLAFAALTSPFIKDRRILPGDEVITVAAGFPTTVNPIIQYGCIPVFVDVELANYQIQISDLEKALTPKTKAIMIAHTLGNPFNAEAVSSFCKKNNLWLIEDCCDAVGAKFNNKMVGTFGDLATVSFYPAHHMTMGEGGAVLTSNIQLKKIVESLRDWGRDCWCPPGVDNSCKKRFEWDFEGLPEGFDHKYIYTHIGYNLKVTDMQAALGCSQLLKLNNFINIRNKNYSFLHHSLTPIQNKVLLPQVIEGATPSWFGFPITVTDPKYSKKNVVNYLNNNGIGTRELFGGNLTRQPLYKNVPYRKIGNLENSDYIMSHSFWVGVYPGLDENKMKYLSHHLLEAFK